MQFDLVLVGGGLQNGLIALAVLGQRPGTRIAIVEKEPSLGANHTWSFHAADVPEAARFFVDPLVEHRWSSYSVLFPGFARRLAQAYASFSSARLHSVLVRALARSQRSNIFLGHRAVSVAAREVTLDDGRVLTAGIVIDARGPSVPTEPHARAMGFQKFIGLEVELTAPGDWTAPVVMDATVAQTDGFRFFYTLPFEPTRWLIEDTYFSLDARLDMARLRGGVLEYAAARGLAVRRVIREETGVLPLPLFEMRDQEQEGAESLGPIVAGYAGGWFHPTTGYSLPVAVRFAGEVASYSSPELLRDALARLATRHRSQSRYARMLNRLLFRGIDADHWRAVFARFYSLPEDTIARFYALALTRSDRMRILCGRPPQGLSWRGLAAVMEAR